MLYLVVLSDGLSVSVPLRAGIPPGASANYMSDGRAAAALTGSLGAGCDMLTFGTVAGFLKNVPPLTLSCIGRRGVGGRKT